MKSKFQRLPRVTEMAHDLIRRFVREGDRVVDATVGNGHDTKFLADLVGPTGKVFGFDIQQSALASAVSRLGDCSWVELICSGHETLPDYVEGEIRAAIFNLGYLPAGNKTITTSPKTTCVALGHAFERLSAPGLINVVVYPGHEGGKDEAEAVEQWLETLDLATTTVAKWTVNNPSSSSPYLIAIVKTATA